MTAHPLSPVRGPLRRPAVALLAVLACVLGLLAAAPARSAPGSTPAALAGSAAPAAKVERRLLDTYTAHERSDLWVLLSARADLERGERIHDRTDRGQAVVDELKDTANSTQAPVKRLLRDKGLHGTSYWAANAVHVEDATLQQARQLSRLPGVQEVRAPRTYKQPEPVTSKPASAVAAGVEWGVASIRADEVWARLGERGEGIVVANVDTGVQFDHPALVGSYRGNNGDGTFTHDYNWFDAAGNCEGAPCDDHGHGTHTMGTMAGDDGQGNQVGVAPGVTWITANGCATCSDADLLESSQWMLAPTDSQGQHPDVSKRPHIVNNSWGSTIPTDEPLFEEVQQAWAASGIFGVWSNGNEGPSCKTSGTPGSRTLNYSVGAYDVNGAIASFSSRGPGQDGETKPNIAAPGVNVRSAYPGDRYAAMSGTSMAAPHTAGAVALLWSAAPSLARDIAGTRALLDTTAVDTADAQCGGSAADNNVWGEGRLDAFTLVQTGAVGIGTLRGTVTDAGTGAPVADATVTVTGQSARTATTDADGRYELRLPAGDYGVSVQAFGYDTAELGAVSLGRDAVLTRDVTLTPAPRVDVTGTVRDGGGTGLALYAKVTADDGDGHRWSAHTDPATGAYTLPLLPGLDYTLTVSSRYSGYETGTRQLSLGQSGQTVDVELGTSLACTAPGYRVSRSGSTEPFDGTDRPRGWTVTNRDPGLPGYDYKPGWVFDNPGARDNATGGSGGFAVVDSALTGAGHVQDSYLTSPVVDMSTRTEATVEFASDLEPAPNSTATVELSTDGGRTWEAVWRNKGFPGAPGPAPQVLPIPQAEGKAKVQVRFHYTGQRSNWWAVDDVFLGDRGCAPVDGALVTGEVTDTGGTGLTGATVTVTGGDQPQPRGTGVATPEDPALGDGFYWLFTPRTGAQTLAAAHDGYAAKEVTAELSPGSVHRIDFTLTGG